MPKNLSSIIDRMSCPSKTNKSHPSHLSPRSLVSFLRSPSLVFTIAFLLLHLTSYADDTITYQAHILPLVEPNCSKCHNPDKKKADLVGDFVVCVGREM